MSNEAQIEYWNGRVGHTWTAAQERMDRMLAPLTTLAIDRADPRSGEQAIDIGCGCGDTALALADRGARVLGLDISAPMLQRAWERAEGRRDLSFRQADASTEVFQGDQQLLFSRFGVMFFADPVAAFANLRTALADGGRMVFMCWQAPAVNPWVSVAGRAIQPFLPDVRAADPREPGPFAFADRDYLHGILVEAGFTRIGIDGATADLRVGGDLDEAMRFQGEIGPTARVLTELEGEVRERAVAAVRAALAAHLGDDGLHLGAATWLVSATGG